MGSTSIYALPYPEASEPDDVPTDMSELAARVELMLSTYTATGLHAARPAAGSVPRNSLYFATDTLGLWRSNGTAWALIAQDAPSITSAQMSAAPWSTPYDGMRIRLVVDATNGIAWEFVYRSGSASTYKWEFVGGTPLVASDASNQTVAVAAAVQIIPPTYLLAVPRAGDYFVDWGVGVNGAPTSPYIVNISLYTTAYAGGSLAMAGAASSTATVSHLPSSKSLLTGLPAGQQIYLAFNGTTITLTFGYRYVSVIPRRIA